MSVLEQAMAKKRKCPECGSEQARRSQMRGLLQRSIYRIIGLKAYRCESCDFRYYEFKRIEVKSEKPEG
jgi:rubredoxin